MSSEVPAGFERTVDSETLFVHSVIGCFGVTVTVGDDGEGVTTDVPTLIVAGFPSGNIPEGTKPTQIVLAFEPEGWKQLTTESAMLMIGEIIAREEERMGNDRQDTESHDQASAGNGSA